MGIVPEISTTEILSGSISIPFVGIGLTTRGISQTNYIVLIYENGEGAFGRQFSSQSSGGVPLGVHVGLDRHIW